MRRYVIRSFRDRLRRDDMRPERGRWVATRARVRCECGVVVATVEEHERGLLIKTTTSGPRGGIYSDDVDTIECPQHGSVRVTWPRLEEAARHARDKGKVANVRGALGS